MKPKISIIIPVYNAENYLKECVDSILNQAFSEYEILLIDDGSSDGSGKLCDEYEGRDERIAVCHQSNHGVSAARNVGIRHAIGDWIMFVDADDYLMDDALNNLYNIAKNSDADYIYGNTLQKSRTKEKLCIPKLKDRVWQNNYDRLVHFGLWGHMFKSSLIKDNNVLFIDGQAYGEDMLFKYSLLQYTRRMASISQPVYVYRENDLSVTKSTNKTRSAHHQLMATKYLFDFAESIDNSKFKRALYRSAKSSRRQIYCDIAFNSSVSDCCAITKDYYQILGNTLSNRFTLYYTVFFLRIKRGIKNLLIR